MPEWKKLMKDRLFVSDLGKSFCVTIEGQSVAMGRYAVWSPVMNSENHQIVEVGDDLNGLCNKYGIPADRICRLNQE